MISQTGEIFFHPCKGRFRVNTSEFKAFAGRNCGKIELAKNICIKGSNPSLFTCALSMDGKALESSGHYLLLVFGESGMDQTTYCQIYSGLTEVRRQGERFVEILDGVVEINNLEGKTIYELAPDGRRNRQLIKGKEIEGNSFQMKTPIVEIVTVL